MFGMFQAGFSQRCATEHPGYLLRPLRIFHASNLGLGTPALFSLLDQEVLVAKRSNLRQMRDAQHLLSTRQRLQLSPNSLRSPPANADVDLDRKSTRLNSSH